jgi:hypothetical protein
MRQVPTSGVLLVLVLNLLLDNSFVAAFVLVSEKATTSPLFIEHHHVATRQRPSRMKATLFPDNKQQDIDDGLIRSSHILTVAYENTLATVRVFCNETILAALERQSPEVAIQLGLPGCALPSDCRRGNCLTCTAQHLPGSQVSNLQPATSVNNAPATMVGSDSTGSGDDSCVVGDGLSPAMSKHVKEMGYALTCSSTITGDGVIIRLNVNDQVWQDLYKVRLEGEEEQSRRQIARQAVAREMRKSAERNVVAWAQQTEEAFKKSSSSNSADDF